MPKAKSGHNLAPLRIDARTWWKLEKHLGVSLGKWARDEIIAAAAEFAVAQHFCSVDKARRKLRGSRSSPTSISRLRTHLKHVKENWGYIQDDPTTQQFFEDVANEIGLGDVDDIMWRLQHLNARLDDYLKPRKYDVFSRYVKKIDVVCEKVMEEAVTITNPAYENQKVSTFVEVMKVLNTALPEYAQQDRSTDSAWAQALILAREV